MVLWTERRNHHFSSVSSRNLSSFRGGCTAVEDSIRCQSQSIEVAYREDALQLRVQPRES